MIDSPHNNMATAAQQRPYTNRSANWLHDAGSWGEIVPNEDSSLFGKTDLRLLPISRFPGPTIILNLHMHNCWRNRTEGRIDIYFEGDSITRRWGTSDDLYKNFLANWNQNFFGWNAADFGWGGDTTQNILWRLQQRGVG